MRDLSIFIAQTLFLSIVLAAIAALPASAQLQLGGAVKLPTQPQFLNCLTTMGGPGGPASGVCVRPSNGLQQPVGDFLLPSGKPLAPIR